MSAGRKSEIVIAGIRALRFTSLGQQGWNDPERKHALLSAPSTSDASKTRTFEVAAHRVRRQWREHLLERRAR